MTRIILIAAFALAACSAGGGNMLANAGADAPKPAPPAVPAPDRCAGSSDYEQCADFLPATRMSGHWITGFETSSFIDDAETEGGTDDMSQERTWLTFADGAAPDPALFAARDGVGGTAVVAIEFIGRRARHPGHYGHLGGAERLVIVDRIISTEFLGPLRR